MTELVGRPAKASILGQNVKPSETGLKLREGMSHEEWLDVGRRIARFSNSLQWWLAEWLIFGDSHWATAYGDAAGVTGYEVVTLHKIASVAGRVEFWRRRANLSFAHHDAVAALDAEAQDAWLTRADAEGMSVMTLREEIRGQRTIEGRARLVGIVVRFTIPPERQQRWQQAAGSEPLEQWAARVLDEAAERALVAA